MTDLINKALNKCKISVLLMLVRCFLNVIRCKDGPMKVTFEESMLDEYLKQLRV